VLFRSKEERYFFRLPAENKDGVQMEGVVPASGGINWRRIIGETIEKTGEKGVRLPASFQIIARDQTSLGFLVEELRKNNFKVELSSNEDAVVTMPSGNKSFSVITKSSFDDLVHDQVLKRFRQAEKELRALPRYKDPLPPIFNPKNISYLEILANRTPTNFTLEENLYKLWAKIVIQTELARVGRLNKQAHEVIFNDFVLVIDDDGNASWLVKLNTNFNLSSVQKGWNIDLSSDRKTRLTVPIGELEQLFYEVSRQYSEQLSDSANHLSNNDILSSSI
jgi:hypothetical protein